MNPHGFVHEVITVRETLGLALVGEPTAKDSWYPPHAWTIALCGTCGAHVGWRFTHPERPNFWGLRTAATRQD